MKRLASIPASPLPQQRACSTRNTWTPEVFEQVTDLLAEALVRDFQEKQARTRATVTSPSGVDHTISLTDTEKRINDADAD